MDTIDRLIRQGDELRNTELGSPKFAVWANDVRAVVSSHGNSMMEILNNALESGVVIMGQRNTNDEAISNTIELLNTIKDRAPEDSRAQDATINQKQAEARATLRSKFGNITVKGDATFGDDSPITKVTVSEFMSALIQEVDAMPDGDEKHTILDSLKSVLANPTFAAVSGSAVSELLKRLLNSQQG